MTHYFHGLQKEHFKKKLFFTEELVSEKLFVEASLGVWESRPFVQVFNFLDHHHHHHI